MNQRFMLRNTAIWDDTKSSRSRVVCDAAINAHDIPDQAEHIAALVVCCRASPTRSESRKRNESAVDVSCTSLDF